MVWIGINTALSRGGALLFQRDMEFPSMIKSTPLKTHPMGSLTAHHQIRDSERHIGEVYASLDSSDLEAYRSGTYTRATAGLLDDAKYSIDSELVVAIINFTDAREIGPVEMRTILDIQTEVADILTMPLIPSITDALSPIVDSDTRFERSPWPAYYSSTRHFLENAPDFNKPIMGVLPSIGWSRRREILREYEGENVQLYAVDFAGLKATSQDCFSQLKDLIGDISSRGVEDNRILYAINYKQYHPVQGSDSYQSEAFALITEGFDIAGGTHIHRFGGSSDGEITDIKIFNSNTFEFDALELSSLRQRWKYPSSIPVDEFIGVSDGKMRSLRKLTNAELMNFAFKKLQSAIQNGDERSFLSRKSGYLGNVAGLGEAMARHYNTARESDLPV